MQRLIPVAAWLVAIVITFAPSVVADEVGRLKVLYVGPDPAKVPDVPFFMPNRDRAIELTQERMPAFKSFLEKHFAGVRAVVADEYNAAMSKDFDVTIFDALPKPLETRGEGVTARQLRLPADFDRPAVMIGDTAPMMLGRFGFDLKLDHLCQCLDSHAHDLRTKHDIFRTPHAVSATLADRPTPLNYKSRLSGSDLGPTMPMWQVQTEGYLDDKGFLIGTVCSTELDDSPDGEVMASGRNDKGRDAVAIGRQGNFLHWGFVASPTYMTDEAKLVFVNAVHYISRFAGQQPLVHRVPLIITRAMLRDTLFYLSDDGLKAANTVTDEMNARFKVEAAKAIEKQKKGQKLTELEFNQIRVKPTPGLDRRQAISYGVPKAVRDRFGDDWPSYLKYYKENEAYLYPLPEEGYMHPLDVDEDAKSFGIANSDIALLDKCTKLLQAGDRAELARRVLIRYTNEKFETADEWRTWLETNRERMFFTEVGGFKFIAMPLKPGKDDSKKVSPAAETKAAASSVPTLAQPVAWTAELEPKSVKPGATATIKLRANILTGWHIYARSPTPNAYTATTVKVEAPAGVSLVDEWQEPEARIDAMSSGAMIYEDGATFSRSIRVSAEAAGAQTIKLVVPFQACNDRECRRPEEKTLTLELELAK